MKLLGGTGSTVRSQAQSDTAVFFNSNSATMVGDALVRYLETHPESIADTAWLFAAIHGAMTDSLIKCWQLKRDVGFWRPFQAIAGAADDGNPDTAPGAGLDALPAQPALLRLRERARLRHQPRRRGDPDPARRDDPAGAALGQLPHRAAHLRDADRSSSTTPSTPASGAGSTSATRCRTRTPSGTAPLGW